MDSELRRLMWLFILIALLRMKRVISQQGFTLVKHSNMMQPSGKIKQVTVKSISECLQHCLSDCRCSTFDIQERNMDCHLKSHRNETLKAVEGYSHFDIKQKPRGEHCDAMKQCTMSINCCLTSNPCSNDATCVPTDDIRNRFKCKCQNRFSGKYCTRCSHGYSGEKCQTRITSCRGYANGTRNPDKYYIRNREDKAVRVFCDFEKDSNISWTLVQSYSLGLHKVYQEPFFTNLPKNSSKPTNWFSYRLGKEMMQWIQTDSTKWRVTCDFDKNLTAIKTDYIEGEKADVDIIDFSGSAKCKRVNYVNIRGHNCSNCTAVLYQTSSYPLHIDAKQSKTKCEFTVTDPKSCSSGGEDSFGLYNCPHQDHRCSATDTSTTNTWLGG